jgi:hypothetical protein
LITNAELAIEIRQQSFLTLDTQFNFNLNSKYSNAKQSGLSTNTSLNLRIKFNFLGNFFIKQSSSEAVNFNEHQQTS